MSKRVIRNTLFSLGIGFSGCCLALVITPRDYYSRDSGFMWMDNPAVPGYRAEVYVHNYSFAPVIYRQYTDGGCQNVFTWLFSLSSTRTFDYPASCLMQGSEFGDDDLLPPDMAWVFTQAYNPGSYLVVELVQRNILSGGR